MIETALLGGTFCKACLPRPQSRPGPVGWGGKEGFSLPYLYDYGLMSNAFVSVAKGKRLDYPSGHDSICFANRLETETSI